MKIEHCDECSRQREVRPFIVRRELPDDGGAGRGETRLEDLCQVCALNLGRRLTIHPV